MKLTRIIALAIIAATSGQAGTAQTLRTASPPAEFPPASYQGRQFVDSRGCVYIRAGIDGATNWVPRVERNRRQICGFQPTSLSTAGTPQRAARTAPELITLPRDAQPAAEPATPAVKTAAQAAISAGAKTREPVQAATRSAPQIVRQKPRRVAPAPKPKRVVAAPAPQPVRRAKRVVVAPVTVPAPQPVVPAQRDIGQCAGLSDISRKYTNQTGDVRCGPQAQSPVTYGSQSSLNLAPNTRVLPAHLYAARQQARGLTPPPGYRAVWQDDRLNPQRAEQDLYPGVAQDILRVPDGFAQVPSSAPRYNPARGMLTEQGNQQMAQVWSDTVPRKPVAAPAPHTIRATNRYAQHPEQIGFLSEETSAKLTTAARYVRAGVFADPEAATAAAQRLQAAGLPVRMGRVTRNGQTFKAVLAGPFHGDSAATHGLSRVVQAGFSTARLSK